MYLTYFVVDTNQQLLRVERDAVEGLWQGRRRSAELQCSLDDELRIVTVLSDDDLEPRVCFFVRLELEQDAITDRSKLDAYEAMTARRQRRYDHPAARRQFVGWPGDWQYQLAVALDVPASQLTRIGLGGPLVMSDLWGISIEQVVEYFDEVSE